MNSVKLTVHKNSVDEVHVELAVERAGVICRMYEDDNCVIVETYFKPEDDLLENAMNIIRLILDGIDLDTIGKALQTRQTLASELMQNWVCKVL